MPITRLPTIRAGLTSGDYSFAGGQEFFAVERKSIPDLIACCTGDNRGRFERELHRLRGFRFKRLLIIGQRGQVERGEYQSKIAPASVLGSLAAWEVRYDIPVFWADTPGAGAVMVERWAWWFARELIKSAEVVIKSE